MFRAIIIDDESSGINALKLLLEKNHQKVKIVATTSDPKKGIELIDSYRPEVVFLDINMPEMDGFEVLKNVSFKNFIVVFTTAHERFAIPAIKKGAFDYLLKPVDVEELDKCIEDINKKLNQSEGGIKSKSPKIIELVVKGSIFFIKPSEVIRVEASGSYSVFHLESGKQHMVSKTLKEIEPVLDPVAFFRCHNSHIVNLSKVIKFMSNDGYAAGMIDGSSVEISRKSKDLFLEKLKSLDL